MHKRSYSLFQTSFCFVCLLKQAESFFRGHKIWIDIFAPIGVLTALIFGVIGIYETRTALYLQFRPYVNLSSISFDEKSKISFEFLNSGESVASDLYFVFSKFNHDVDFGEELFDCRTSSGTYLYMDVVNDAKIDKKLATAVIPLLPTGDLPPRTAKQVELTCTNEEDILWLKGGEPVNLRVLFRDRWDNDLEHYYQMRYDRGSSKFHIFYEVHVDGFVGNEGVPIGSSGIIKYVGKYYVD